MGMGEWWGILEGAEKSEPLPHTPPWIPAWAGGRTIPCLSRYIPAVGEVRGQGMKVPVCVSREAGSRGAVQKMPPPPHSTRYCTEPSGRTLRARTRTGSPRDR